MTLPKRREVESRRKFFVIQLGALSVLVFLVLAVYQSTQNREDCERSYWTDGTWWSDGTYWACELVSLTPPALRPWLKKFSGSGKTGEDRETRLQQD